MRVIALDLSTLTGYAVLEGDPQACRDNLTLPTLVNYGLVSAESFHDLVYPWSFLARTLDLADKMKVLLAEKYDAVVVEETNMGRNRYSQKTLEWIHIKVLEILKDSGVPVFYVNTSDWRRKLGTTLTKDDKKLNAKVRKLKKAGDKEGLRKLGVRGRIGKKHVAIRFVNSHYNLNLKLKDDDIADAICLGASWFLGVPTCDGK